MDFCIIIVATVDVAVLQTLRAVGIVTWSPMTLSLFRSLRLVRLISLFRVFKRFPQLQLLLLAFVKVYKTIFWILVLMMLVIYSFGIYMIILTQGRYAPQDGVLAERMGEYFGGMPEAMLTAWRLTALDDWGTVIITEVTVDPIHAIPSLMLVIVLGLGLMKMAVGVMCESAISLVRTRQQEQNYRDIVSYIRTMEDLRKLFLETLGTSQIPQEVIEQCLGMKLRPRIEVAKLHGRSSNDEFDMPPKVQEIGTSLEFLQQVYLLLKKANLSPEVVKKIFEKLDYNRHGFITVDDLTRGGLMVKDYDLTKINVFAIAEAICQIREKCKLMDSALRDCHIKLDSLVCNLKTLIYRQRQDNKKIQRRKKRQQEEAAAAQKQRLASEEAYHNMLMMKNAQFDEYVGDALQNLASFRHGSGVKDLPGLRDMGQLHVVRGSGKVELKQASDKAADVIGELDRQGLPTTDFKREFEAGDILLLQLNTISRTGADDKQQLALVVSAVHDAFHCRVLKEQKNEFEVRGQSSGAVPFVIVKQRKHTRKLGTRSDIKLELDPPLVELSPRSSQRVLDWELQTRQLDVQRAWERRHALWLEYHRLNKELDALDETEMIKTVVEAWKEETRTMKALKKKKR